ncbi:MAG TPA: PAS domain-containing protein, partial [Chitinophagaceae bacterium]|nr:PAS domain-containing protein [Chitinophagaceae bacterium]
MSIFHTHDRMYDFVHLPAYASFLLEHHIDDYTKETIHLSREVQLPVLKLLGHLSETELYQFSKATTIEFLTFLSQNKAKQQIESSLQKWISNQLPLIGKYDIDARDITILNYVRVRLLKNWITEYSRDLDTILGLNAELDLLQLGQNTTSINTYIQILKERIEEEAHFSKNVINASPGITYIFDLEAQKISYINGKVGDVMGYTTNDVLGKESNLIVDYAHEEDHPVVFGFVKAILDDRDGKTQQAEFRFRDKEGNYRWFRSYGVVYKRDANGTPVQLLGSGFEISNEKEIAGALQKREQQLLEAQAIAHIGSFEWNILQDTYDATPELRKIFETEGEQNFETMMSKIHPEDIEKVKTALDESFRTGAYTSEYRYKTRNGEKVIDSKGIVTFDKQGNAALMSGTVQDITERKQIEETLIKKTLDLERSNTQLQEFASIASHDLKEPLRKIATFADMIVSTEDNNLTEKGKANLTKITDAALRMQQLIDGILSYSSIESEIQKQPSSLETLFKEALTNLETRLKDTNAVVYTDGLPEATVVPFQIQQVFQNLIS